MDDHFQRRVFRTVNRMLPLMTVALSTSAAWCNALLRAIACHVVDDRPDRYEPRVRKRRPKNYRLMIQPRQNYQRRMAQGVT